MEPSFDRYRASRGDVLAHMVAQQGRIADPARRVAEQEVALAQQRAATQALQQRVGEVLALLEPGDDGATLPRPTTMPGLKPAATGKAAAPSAPRTRRAHGFGRRRMTPTARQMHADDRCPACHTPLRGGTRKRRRAGIALLPARVEVTAHVSVARRCPRCGGQWQPGPEVAALVVGQRRLGGGLLSLIATWRAEMRLPIARIQWYLAAVHGLALSVGAIVAALHLVAARAAPVVAGIRETIRAGPVLHVDETGWRQAGHNGYAWTFSPETARAFVQGGRDTGVLAEAIGDPYAGVLGSDVSAVSTSDDGRHQYCWAHLLRDGAELVGQHRQDAVGRGWADRVHGLYQRACALAASLATAEAPPRRQARQACEAARAALCAPYLGVTDAPQRGLAARMDRHLGELFVFVAEPAPPPTNNAAERSLRHLVTRRKISGGTRSPAGTATKLTLATLVGAWRAQGRNPLAECRAPLTAPQV